LSQFSLLLTRARNGDLAARDELFAFSRPFLSQVAEQEVASWLRPKQDASDLVQLSLLEAHRAFATFQGEDFAQWLAFLRRILERNATDAVRHYGAAKRQAGREIALHPQASDASSLEGPQLAASSETPSVEALRHEQSDRLRQAITQLSPDHQEIIRLRNLEQLPFEEIAERMNRTRPAVQMLWMRALKKLEEILQQTDPSLGG
jgi:RNA polymerase sigma-70 factor (ECF subfamily)